MVTKSRIDKIGNILKSKDDLTTQELQDLLTWRNTFSKSLDYYHHKLKANISQIETVSLARRLKRIESIQIKLKRFKTMRLSTLQDIAGLRLVVEDNQALQDITSKIRSTPSKHSLKRFDNYHSKAKEDGYRGIHMVYQDETGMMVEIQFRTELEHIWATAVEIYGELQNTSFKTGEGEEEWKEFFALLSSYFAIKEKSPPLKKHINLSEKKIKSLLKYSIKNLKVIETLNSTTNNISVISKKYNHTGRKGKYAILELNLSSKETHIEFFNSKDLDKAIEIYTRKELEQQNNKNTNIVLVNVEDVNKIEKSYPNYFLNTNRLLEILSKIVLNEF